MEINLYRSKISENYKPPEKIAITQSVAQRLANPSVTVQLLATTNDFTLERTVLTEISKWQHVQNQQTVFIIHAAVFQ